jgi:hypothetical protein
MTKEAEPADPVTRSALAIAHDAVLREYHALRNQMKEAIEHAKATNDFSAYKDKQRATRPAQEARGAAPRSDHQAEAGREREIRSPGEDLHRPGQAAPRRGGVSRDLGGGRPPRARAVAIDVE